MIDQEVYVDSYRRLQDALLARYELAATSRLVYLDRISTQIHVLEAGAGKPVLLLHGGAGTGAQHIPVVARLARHFRVIVPDRPGHGLSDDFDYRGHDLRKANVDFVESLLNALGIERAALVGNSYGGFMAVNFVLVHPERVSNLILLGFAPGLLDRRLPLMMRLMVTPILGTLLGATLGRPSNKNTRMLFLKILVAHIDRVPDELVELETAHSRRHRHSISRLFRAGLTTRGFRREYVIRDQLPNVRVPTTFPWGEHDARLVPGGRFEVISGAGHLPSTDQPEATAALLEAALGAR